MPPEASFPSIYLRELHAGLVEGDALDAGQREVLFSEQLCERDGQGAQSCVQAGQCGPARGPLAAPMPRAGEGLMCPLPFLGEQHLQPPSGSPPRRPGLSNAHPFINILFYRNFSQT